MESIISIHRHGLLVMMLQLSLLLAACSETARPGGRKDAAMADAKTETDAESERDAGLPGRDAGGDDAGAAADALKPSDPGRTDAAGQDDGGRTDAGAEDAGIDGGFTPPEYPPDRKGPYSVGHREITVWDYGEFPPVSTKIGVWYPGQPAGDRTKYMWVFQGAAYEDAPADSSGAPYPLVMFSHGHKGINFQSFSYYEHLVSHGFIVAAPDHEGDTLFDNPSDQQIAEAAMRRPQEIMDAMSNVLDDEEIGPLVNAAVTGISGHSFGGYTAILLAGAEVDVEAARRRCAQGVPGDYFCPYLEYYPAGTVLRRPAGAERFLASLAMAPGGYAAFGDEGLTHVTIPVFLMGGALDEYTANDIEPLYAALAPPKLKLIIDRGGHMVFSDVCRLPASQYIPGLDEMCNPETHIDMDRGFEIVNVFATAYFRYHLKGEAGMRQYLTDGFAATIPEADFTGQW